MKILLLLAAMLCGFVLVLATPEIGLVVINVSMTIIWTRLAYLATRGKDKGNVMFALFYIGLAFIAGIIISVLAYRNGFTMPHYTPIYFATLTITLFLPTLMQSHTNAIILSSTCFLACICPWLYVEHGQTLASLTGVARDFTLSVFILMTSVPKDNNPPRRRNKAKRNSRWTWLLPTPTST